MTMDKTTKKARYTHLIALEIIERKHNVSTRFAYMAYKGERKTQLALKIKRDYYQLSNQLKSAIKEIEVNNHKN